MKPLRVLLGSVLLAVAVCGSPARAAGLPSANVAWVAADTDAQIDQVFARARAERKPVLLYWGASWCPPCNQLKATLFNRQDFALQSRSFIAVAIDGDRPAAQKLGTRFQVRGYPTLVLYTPAGAELTRLPGEADAPQVLALLQAGLAGGRPIRDVLADARAPQPALSADEWRTLAFYAWEAEGDPLVPASTAARAQLLAELAAKVAGDGETATRLWLKSLAARAEGAGDGKLPAPALRQRVLQVLADPAQARAQMDVIANAAADIVRAFGAGADRPALVAAFDRALAGMQDDATLSRADRASALVSRVELARLAAGVPEKSADPVLPAALTQSVRELAARFDRETRDPYERQAVIPTLAHLQGRAGLWADSDALLLANLDRSVSPYYLMSQLGANARARGRPAEALRWYEKAFDGSTGPATRLQWGAAYVAALVALTPADGARIEQVAARLFDEAARDGGSFHERSARSLQRVGRALAQWNAGGAHAAALQRLRRPLDRLCARVEAENDRRAACRALLDAGRPGAAPG